MSELRVTLTGTGSPRPSLDRANSGQIIHAGERPILLDCGGGTTRRAMEAGIDLARIELTFFTHLHSDHTLDYAEFMLGSWAMGRSRMRVYGPPGIERLHNLLLLEPYADDIAYRSSLGRSTAGILDVGITEFKSGTIFDEDGLTVRAIPVVHSTFTVALRFDFQGQSIVHSGDTCYTNDLAKFAANADILIHDACMAPSPAFENNPAWPHLFDHLKAHHATPEEAGRTAREAGVRTLVLTHFLLNADVETARQQAESEFDGEIIIGKDLQTISCQSS